MMIECKHVTVRTRALIDSREPLYTVHDGCARSVCKSDFSRQVWRARTKCIMQKELLSFELHPLPRPPPCRPRAGRGAWRASAKFRRMFLVRFTKNKVVGGNLASPRGRYHGFKLSGRWGLSRNCRLHFVRLARRLARSVVRRPVS